jgi:hypothetical protein
MRAIKEQVKQLSTRPDYDINVWSEGGYVYVTFYPLRYPGDASYPDADLIHGFAVVDTSEFYSLKIHRDARGPLFKDTLAFLKGMVNYDHETLPDNFPTQEWDDTEGMDWWSTESELAYAPSLITDFIKKLPRRDNV